MYEVSVKTPAYSCELHALANRLGGQCTNEVISDRGIVTSFTLQFRKASHWYSEVEAQNV